MLGIHPVVGHHRQVVGVPLPPVVSPATAGIIAVECLWALAVACFSPTSGVEVDGLLGCGLTPLAVLVRLALPRASRSIDIQESTPSMNAP